MRIRDEDGRILDPDGLLVSSGTGLETDVRVAFGRDTWLVAWPGARASAPHPQDTALVARRITREGSILGSANIEVARQVRRAVFDLAWDGAQFIAVWTSEDVCPCVNAAGITRGGTPQTIEDVLGLPVFRNEEHTTDRSSGIVVGVPHGAPNVPTFPTLSAADRHTLLVWDEDVDFTGAHRLVRGARLPRSTR